MLRAALLVTTLALLWSSVWFQPDGVTLLVPGVGGYHWSYAD
jgi:hypothetical protein